MAGVTTFQYPEPSKQPFILELSRLRNEFRDLGSRLEQIEADLRRLLDDIYRDRWADYR